jgi:hypothetical protein
MNELSNWKIFLSSTAKDLSDIRNRTTNYLRYKYFDVIRYEDNFIKNANQNAQKICIDNVKTADFFILILDKVYGSSYKEDNSISITEAEFLEAKKQNIPFIFFIKKQLADEYADIKNTLINKGITITINTLRKEIQQIKLRYASDKKLILFVHKLMEENIGNYASYFETYEDLEKEIPNRLRDFSFSIFSRLINEQEKVLKSSIEFWSNLENGPQNYIPPSVKKFPDNVIKEIDIPKVISELIKEQKYCIVIQGKAGAGKTTEIIKSYMNDVINDTNYISKMKLFVKLKDITVSKLGKLDPRSILNYQIESMLGKKSYEFIPDDIQYHIYLDGLDEIAVNPNLKDFDLYITDELLRFPLVISSRIEVSEQMRLLLTRKEIYPITYEICEWDKTKATLYLTNSFNNTPSVLKWINEDETQNKVIPVIKNPLTAAMLVFIIFENDSELPVGIYNRAAVFDRFIDKWLNRELIRLSIDNRKIDKTIKKIRLALGLTAWELYQARVLRKKINLKQLIEKVHAKNNDISVKILNSSSFQSLLIINKLTDEITGFVHEQFMEYFIAELFVNYCIKNDSNIKSYLVQNILGDVNGFIKAIWDKYEDKILTNILEFLQSQFNDETQNTVQTQANILYYISRIHLSDNSKIKEYFTNISFNASHLYVKNGALFSLVRLGDFLAEERLYASFTTDQNAASYNRRLHLEYFSDILPSNEAPPILDDNKSDWSRSCRKLLEHIYDHSERFIFTKRIDIFTIRSLMSSRGRRGPLSKERLESICSSVITFKDVYSNYQDILNKALAEYELLKKSWNSLPE